MGMAGQLDRALAHELEYRYRFHVAVQEMIGTLTHWDRQLQEAMSEVVSQREPSPESLHAVGHALRQAQDALGQQVAVASNLRLPAFRNMQAGHPLSHFLDAKPVIHDLFGSQQITDGTWINQILQRHAEIIDKLRRILFKSLGSLLCFQERVGDDWKEKYRAAMKKPTLRDVVDTAPPASAKDSGAFKMLPSNANAFRQR